MGLNCKTISCWATMSFNWIPQREGEGANLISSARYVGRSSQIKQSGFVTTFICTHCISSDFWQIMLSWHKNLTMWNPQTIYYKPIMPVNSKDLYQSEIQVSKICAKSGWVLLSRQECNHNIWVYREHFNIKCLVPILYGLAISLMDIQHRHCKKYCKN